MSELDNSMSMNSLMEAIYGDHHTQYLSQAEDHLAEQIPTFMQSLINHLVQLCVTQTFADHVRRSLTPWIKQYILHQKNPKSTIQGFLKQYLGLFEQETHKINKYGQKKLKYLTQTVSKQIFTQIMRMACDLKLQSVNRTNHLRSAHRRGNNITILNHAINKLFLRQQMHAFKILKKNHFINIQKQQNFVGKLTNSINSLDRIYMRKKRSRLCKGFALWRKRNIEISQQQSTIISSSIQDFFMGILPQIIEVWGQSPINWVVVIIEHIQNLMQNMVGRVEGISIQFLANPCFQHVSSLDYSALSSYRSGISQLSSISIGEYLKTDQIKYDNNNKFIAIPIIAQQQIGLIKISWQYQLPIVLFNKTLKTVEELKHIIEGFAKITTRLGYYTIQYESNSWHLDLYNLSLKQQALGIKSFQPILSAANILFLEIYHDKHTPNSCIKYGKQYAHAIPQHIYQIIWDKLQIVSSFCLDRQFNNCEIVKLQNDKGFCRFAFEPIDQTNDRRQLNGIIIQCIVPLLVKNLGKIGCPTCNIKINQRIPIKFSQNLKQDEPMLIDLNYKFMMMTKEASNIQQMQKCIYNLLQQRFEKTPIFAKFFYPLSESDRSYAYNCTQNTNKLVEIVQLPKALINENICNLLPKQSDQDLSKLSTVMRTNPLFKDAQIYLYQNQKKNSLKFMSKKIGRKAILMISTYQSYSQGQINQIMNLIGTQIQKNQNIFTKQDIFMWCSQVLNKKHLLQLTSNQQISHLCDSTNKLQFNDLVINLCSIMSNPNQFFIWRIGSNKSVKLINNTEISMCLQLPKQLIQSQQSIQSHQKMIGVHRKMGNSKNYGSKMQQLLSYVPNFGNEQLKIEYAQMIRNNTDGEGESTDKMVSSILDYLSTISNFNRHSHQFISIPIKFQSCKYVALLVYNKNVYIPQQSFNAIDSLFRRIFSAIKSQKQQQAKTNALISFKNILHLFPLSFEKKQTRLKELINKFVRNKNERLQKNKQIQFAIAKLQHNTNYKQYKFAMDKIQKFAYNLRNVYVNNSELLCKKIMKTFCLTPLIQKLEKKSGKTKGANKVWQTIQRILNSDTISGRISKRLFLQTLYSIHKTRMQTNTNNKQISIKIMQNKCSQIFRRNMSQLYFKNLQSILSLKRSLKFLQEQFNLMCPKSLRLCLEFLTGRLNLMLSQHFMKPVSLKLVSSNYLQSDPSTLLHNENIIFIQNTSFAFATQHQNISVYRDTFDKFVQPVLQHILPPWEIKIRKHQLFRLKIFYGAIENYKHKNLRIIFNVHSSQKNKQNIQQCINMRKKAQEEKQKMVKMQNVCNPSINLQNREKYKKQIDELKYETNIIQNQLHQTGVQSNIKSKTNAAYRMLNILNKKKLLNLNESDKSISFPKKKELSQVKSCIEEDNYRFICEIMPTWFANFDCIIKGMQKKRVMQFLNKYIETLH